MENKLNYRLLNVTLLSLLILLIAKNITTWWGFVSTIIMVMMPFIIAFVFAYALHPLILKLEDKGIRHGFSVTIVVVAVVLILSALLAITLPLVYEQLILFSKMVIQVMEDVSLKFDLNLGNIEVKITDFFNEAIANVGKLISDGTVNLLSRSIGFFGSFIVGFIAWIYFLADMNKIRLIVSGFLRGLKGKAYRYFKAVDEEIGNYIKGLSIFMVIQLIEYSLLFFFVGHPNWLLLGILACVTTVIPYFGGLITNIIAVITASVVSTPTFIGTAIICLIFPQLDGYVISPKVYGKTNNVNALITIMVVSIGGTLAGILGIVAALPVYLFVRTTYHFYIGDIKKSVKKVATVK